MLNLLSKYPFIAMVSTIIFVTALILLLDKSIKQLIVGFIKKNHATEHLQDGRQKENGKIAN
jgi:hypothetical protein